MTPASFIRDLTAFWVQIAFVVIVVAGLLKVVSMPARARYVCLRLALLACLVAPWMLRSVVVVTPEPRLERVAGAVAPLAAGPVERLAAALPHSATAAPAYVLPEIPWATVALVALFAGVAARGLWLAVGVLRLRRLRRRAMLVDSPDYAAAQQQVGTSAAIAQVEGLPQPVTFGFRRPIVLLPETLAAAPAALRRAVVTHELFHVRRRDWLSVLGEEALRTLLWFHPAILWLTSHIQLAREEMVDELTVRATGDRRAYMEALLAFADTGGAPPGSGVCPPPSAVSPDSQRVEGEGDVCTPNRGVRGRADCRGSRRELVREHPVPDRQGRDGRRAGDAPSAADDQVPAQSGSRTSWLMATSSCGRRQ